MAKKKLTLSIDPELIKKAKIKAIEQGISLSEKVAQMFEEWVLPEPTEEEEKTPE